MDAELLLLLVLVTVVVLVGAGGLQVLELPELLQVVEVEIPEVLL